MAEFIITQPERRVKVDEPVAITGSITAAGSTSTTGANTNVSVGNTNTAVLSLNTSRKGFSLVNNGAATIFIEFGATATTSSSFPLTRGTYYLHQGDGVYTGAINAIVASGSESLRVVEFT